MSDVAIIVTAICGVITALGVPLIALLMAQLNAKQAEAAKEVKEVKNALSISDKAQTAKVDAVVTKLDDNTALTKTVVAQTNGLPDALRAEIDHLKAEIRSLKTSHR